MATDPLAAVREYIEAFNRADVDALAAACADPMQILDGMAPHVWHGPTATRDWWRDVLADGEHVGASGYHVTLGEPRRGESSLVLLREGCHFNDRVFNKDVFHKAAKAVGREDLSTHDLRLFAGTKRLRWLRRPKIWPVLVIRL